VPAAVPSVTHTPLPNVNAARLPKGVISLGVLPCTSGRSKRRCVPAAVPSLIQRSLPFTKRIAPLRRAISRNASADASLFVVAAVPSVTQRSRPATKTRLDPNAVSDCGVEANGAMTSDVPAAVPSVFHSPLPSSVDAVK
jgi:hypothetical protein